MTKLYIRPLARQDLKNIWTFSYQKWGRRQADSYLNALGLALNALAVTPDKGKPNDHVKKKLPDFPHKRALRCLLSW